MISLFHCRSFCIAFVIFSLTSFLSPRPHFAEEWLTACESQLTAGPTPAPDLQVQARYQTLVSLLLRVTEFLQVVFVAALIRDARSVLQRYHKHCIRAIVAPF
jgi:hypothetical protein